MADNFIVQGHYIVTFKPHVTGDVADAHVVNVQTMVGSNSTLGLPQSPGLIHRYEIGSFVGYSGGFDQDTLTEIRNSPDVASVEPDVYVETQDDDKVQTESNVPSWGLARICRDRRVDDSVTTYVYNEPNGANTHAYVIDTGIYTEHNEFNNGNVCRARWGTTIVSGSEKKSTSDTDQRGHGTHVAGTIAGYTCGVAKEAQVIAVKVFPDLTEEEKKQNKKKNARTSDIIKALQWSVDDAGDNIRRCVVNMSLGGGRSEVFNSAVRATVYAGMTVVVASGNKTHDASLTSPASAPEAITVGATKEDDSTRKTSNYGKLVDVLAPGDKITSAGIGSPSELVKKSGTSMASPHTAGVVCSLISQQDSNPQPVTMVQLVKKMAGRNQITMVNQPDTLNLILNNGLHV